MRTFRELFDSSWTHVGERLVWYGGAEVSFYASDTIELQRLWRWEPLHRSLCIEITSHQGLDHLGKVCGIPDPCSKVYRSLGNLRSALESNKDLASVLIDKLHRSSYRLLRLMFAASSLPLDVNSPDASTRRLSRKVLRYFDNVAAPKLGTLLAPRFIGWLIENTTNLRSLYVDAAISLGVHNPSQLDYIRCVPMSEPGIGESVARHIEDASSSDSRLLYLCGVADTSGIDTINKLWRIGAQKRMNKLCSSLVEFRGYAMKCNKLWFDTLDPPTMDMTMMTEIVLRDYVSPFHL